MNRQIILDTETTGLDVTRKHKIIEIGCVELIDRKYTGNNFHHYLNPERKIDQGAINVHGISNEFLEDKPLFIDVKDDLLNFIKGAELIIHNAPFDVGFIEYEFNFSSQNIKLSEECKIFDTLVYARRLHPGQKNSLDALCKRYNVDNSSRDFHGALLDAKILGDVYLAMTGGQTSFELPQKEESRQKDNKEELSGKFVVIKADEEELREHQELCKKIDEISRGRCIWKISKF